MGYTIAELRRKKKLSQSELAERSKVSRATISGIESGRISVVKSSTLQKLAQALEKPIGDLIF